MFEQIAGDDACYDWARVATEDASGGDWGAGTRFVPFVGCGAAQVCSKFGEEGGGHDEVDGGKQNACTANEPRSVKRCIDKSALCCRGQVEPVQVSGSHPEGHVRFAAIRGSVFGASCRIGVGNRVKGNFHDTTSPTTDRNDPDAATGVLTRNRTEGGSPSKTAGAFGVEKD